MLYVNAALRLWIAAARRQHAELSQLRLTEAELLSWLFGCLVLLYIHSFKLRKGDKYVDTPYK